MSPESLKALLSSLTGQSGESTEAVYAKWQAVAQAPLETMVRRTLVANGKTAQLRESLPATLRAGGAVGESPEQMLLKTGLTGWA